MANAYTESFARHSRNNGWTKAQTVEAWNHFAGELIGRIEKQEEQIKELEAKNVKLEAEVEVLTDIAEAAVKRLNRDSQKTQASAEGTFPVSEEVTLTGTFNFLK